MTGRKIAALAALCTGVMLVNGCSMLDQEKEWKPQKSSAISVGKDGTITEYVNDTLDESYYSTSELQSMIESQLSKHEGFSDKWKNSSAYDGVWKSRRLCTV